MMAVNDETVKPKHIVIGNLQEEFLFGLKKDEINILSSDLNKSDELVKRFGELAPTRPLEDIRVDLLDLQRNLATLAGWIVGDIPGSDDPSLLAPEGGWGSNYLVVGGRQQNALWSFYEQGIDVRTIDPKNDGYPKLLKDFKSESGYSPEAKAAEVLGGLRETMIRVAGMVLVKPDAESMIVQKPEVEVPEVHRLIRNVFIKIVGEMVSGNELAFKVGDQGDSLRIVDPEGVEHVVRVAGDVLEVEGKGSKFQDRLNQLTLLTNQQDKARKNRTPKGKGLLVKPPIDPLISESPGVSEEEMKIAAARVIQIQGRN